MPMSSIITRSAAEYWAKMRGKTCEWPKDWRYVADGKPVTLADIRARRRREQAEHLARMLKGCYRWGRKPAQVWVFFVPGFIYGGWHLYVRTFRNAVWVREGNSRLAQSVMRQLPCGCLPGVADFDEWKEAFWKQYKVKGARRKTAVFNGWIDECGYRIGDEFYIGKGDRQCAINA